MSDHIAADASGAPFPAAATLLQDRYRDRRPAGPAHWNETLATLLSHRSVRAYRSDPVPEEALELAIAAAQSGASSQNMQMWSVVAVEDRARIVRLAKISAAQGFIEKAPLFLAWLVDLARLGLAADERGVETAALHHLEPFIIATIDATIAAQNAVIAFESLGLGTVYIGAFRYEPEAVIEELRLPAHVAPIFGMCVGYPDPAAPAGVKPRLSPSAVLHREHYRLSHQREAILAYDAKMHEFQKEQGLPLVDWSTNSVRRIEILRQQIDHRHYGERLKRLGFAR